jgi:hypothetical protein
MNNKWGYSMSRIYLASSWGNKFHSEVLQLLVDDEHKVYNFKDANPIDAGVPVPTSFSWSELDKDYKNWTPIKYRDVLLKNARAQQGFMGDFRGMEWADICILLLPCGRSAHVEAGHMKGRSKRLIIYYHNNNIEGFEPDLMYLLADNIVIGKEELLYTLKK